MRTSLCSVITHHTSMTVYQLSKASIHSNGSMFMHYSHYIFSISHSDKSLLKFLPTQKPNLTISWNLLEVSKECYYLKRGHTLSYRDYFPYSLSESFICYLSFTLSLVMDPEGNMVKCQYWMASNGKCQQHKNLVVWDQRKKIVWSRVILYHRI